MWVVTCDTYCSTAKESFFKHIERISSSCNSMKNWIKLVESRNNNYKLRVLCFDSFAFFFCFEQRWNWVKSKMSRSTTIAVIIEMNVEFPYIIAMSRIYCYHRHDELKCENLLFRASSARWGTHAANSSFFFGFVGEFIQICDITWHMSLCVSYHWSHNCQFCNECSYFLAFL